MSWKADNGPFAAGARHLHGLGPRALSHFLEELGESADVATLILAKLEAWRNLTPEQVQATGGNRFPPAPLDIVRTGTRS